MKITVIGMGYVGLSNAILLSQKYEVVTFDIDKNKVAQLNNKISPIVDAEIENFLQNKSLKLSATSDKQLALTGSNFIIIATSNKL
jgi:UDPglucose 6-dehydrogenase